MTKKRLRLAALLAVWLCLLIAAPAAQAQFVCSILEGYGVLYDNERLWYNNNCVIDPDDDDEEEESYRPPDVTCPHLPSRVVVSGYVENTQCQMVGEVVIHGYPDLQARGFIDAVDVWLYVNGGVEVCFYNDGWLVFLDASFILRVASELEHTHRDGMTCGMIDGAGTVVLLAAGPGNAPTLQVPVAPDTQPGAVTLPVFESVPLHDCQIKLVETLFLRAEPAGEIIGLVWLNTIVSAFEINGYWYKIEFEGTTGYISRYYREVLRGGCG